MENIHCPEVLRVRVEELGGEAGGDDERNAIGICGGRVLQTCGQRVGKACNIVQVKVESVVALDKGSTGRACFQARVGGDNLRHQRTVAAGLDRLEGLEEAVAGDVAQIGVVAAVESGAVITYVGNREHRVLCDLVLHTEAQQSTSGRLHAGIGHGEGVGTVSVRYMDTPSGETRN